jgi:Calcineurin-like phosphoesterase
VEWLEAEISRAREAGEMVIVMTHHAPTFHRTSHPKVRANLNRVAYATNLEHLLGPPVALWCHGHTHYSYDQVGRECSGSA